MTMRSAFPDSQVLKVTASANTPAGELYLHAGGWNYVPKALVSGEQGIVYDQGRYAVLATDADVWAEGDTLYYDPATDRITDVAGALTKAGYAATAKAASTDAKYEIILTPNPGA